MENIIPIKGIQLEDEEQIYTFNADAIVYDYDEEGNPISVKQALSGLLYTPITISNLQHNLGKNTFEFGTQKFSSIRLDWKVNNVKNKEDLSQFLNNESIQPDIIDGKYSYEKNIKLGESAGTKTFTIKAQENTSNGKSEDTKSIHINFYKPVYYGCTDEENPNGTDLDNGAKILQASATNNSIKFVPDPVTGQYVFYAIPKSYLGTNDILIFKDDATQIEYDTFTPIEIEDFSPNDNYTEDYLIFRSPYKYKSAVTFIILIK